MTGNMFTFVDQTRRTIRKSKGIVPKRAVLPGTFKLRFLANTRSRKPAAPSDPFERYTDEMNLNTVGPGTGKGGKIEQIGTVETVGSEESVVEVESDHSAQSVESSVQSEPTTRQVGEKKSTEIVQQLQELITDSAEEIIPMDLLGADLLIGDMVPSDSEGMQNPETEINALLRSSESSNEDGNQRDKTVTFNNQPFRLDMSEYSIPMKFDNTEFVLTMHYCNVMCAFYSVKDPRWNIDAYVGNSLAVQYPPLKLSLLAWSGLHLSMKDDSRSHVALDYYDASCRAVMKRSVTDAETSIELALATCFFLIQFDLMRGNAENMRQILKHAWSGLAIQKVFDGHSPMRLSSFCYRVMDWLLYIDVQCALLHGNVVFADYLASDNLEGCLKTYDFLDDKVLSYIFGPSKKLLKQVYGSVYPNHMAQDDDALEEIGEVLTRDNIMFAKLIRLRSWLNQYGNSLEVDVHSIELEILSLRAPHQKLLSCENRHAPVVLNTLLANAMFHSLVIFFDRIVHPNIRSNDKCQKAAAEIVKIAFHFNKFRNPGTPGCSQWPFPLFLAGIETTDQIYQQWVLAELQRYASEGWGKNITKATRLYSECVQRQSERGTRVDIGEVMVETTGIFVL